MGIGQKYDDEDTAVQPRILSKKNKFHLRINGGTQEEFLNF